MKSRRNLEAVKQSLNVALLPITNNRVLSFIFIVLVLVLIFIGMPLLWELICNALLRILPG